MSLASLLIDAKQSLGQMLGHCGIGKRRATGCITSESNLIVPDEAAAGVAKSQVHCTQGVCACTSGRTLIMSAVADGLAQVLIALTSPSVHELVFFRRRARFTSKRDHHPRPYAGEVTKSDRIGLTLTIDEQSEDPA